MLVLCGARCTRVPWLPLYPNAVGGFFFDPVDGFVVGGSLLFFLKGAVSFGQGCASDLEGFFLD